MKQHELPAPGFRLTKGRQPRTGEKKLSIQFANGMVDDKWTYTASQIRWTETGSEWDAAAVKIA